MGSIVIGTAGHVDHGKSTLVRALTGADPDRPGVDRVAVDRLKDERRRGITIDLGFASTSIGDLDVAFVDVPGHERFVRNMLAGAGGFDAVLLVVAADESVMPQTREHLAICRLLGLSHGVIAVTKSDRVDADTRAIVELETRELVAGTFLAGAAVVPVSAQTGEGLDDLRSALAALAPRNSGRLSQAAARLAVDRAFSAKGFGTVVTGTLVSGTVGEGEELELLPTKQRARVRGLHVHGHAVPRAEAPRRVALNLGHVAVADVPRGVTVASPDTLTVTRRLDVELELLKGSATVRHGARVRVHLGTSEVGARVAVCAMREAPTADWQAAGVGEVAVTVPSGASAYVRLRLDAPLAATRGDRFVVRASSPHTTVGGGVVLDPQPPARGLRRAAALPRFSALAFAPGVDSRTTAEAVIGLLLGEAGPHGLAGADLVRRVGLGFDEADALCQAVVSSGRGVRAAGETSRVFDAALVAAAEQAVLAALKAPRVAAEGLARETLRPVLMRRAGDAWFELILGRLAQAGQIVGTDRITLAGQSVAGDPELEGAKARVEEALRQADLSPPDMTALAVAVGLAAPLVERAVRTSTRDRRLVRLGDLVFHADRLAALRTAVVARGREAQAAGQPPRIDVATFKTAYGLSRKFAIPLLEWLDRERVTRRVGDSRLILP